MGDQIDEGLDRQSCPELLAWLAEREAAFEPWATALGRPLERWDFSARSLDALEDLVRERFADAEEVMAAKSGAFVQGATWYIGEAIRRSFAECGTHDPLVWMYDPAPLTGRAPSSFFDPATRVVTDTPFVGLPGSVDGEWLYPMGALYELYSTVNEWDEPIEPHLRGVLHDPYDDEDEEDDEDENGG
ncbi:hypothetical protein J7E88_23715 [Streptomyces sp. ISL-10]|uniref:hypothetical protein n=1 Tax=Streptomyces sp. ISL-10 TaxID=2819172 RepID=UPI001BEB863E|nr:hypothetical protein [Streptomyces sp. ISL-10]MBT2368247.1 hypothetical protein [Streptomyces sp. ISL-10]